MATGAQVERPVSGFPWGKAEVVINLRRSLELPGKSIIYTNRSGPVVIPTENLRYLVPTPEQDSSTSAVWALIRGYGNAATATLAAENDPKLRTFRRDFVPYAGFAQTVVEDALYAAWQNSTTQEEVDGAIGEVLKMFKGPKGGAATIRVLERYTPRLLVPGVGEQTPHKARGDWLILLHNDEGFEDLKRELGIEFGLYLASSDYAKKQRIGAIEANRKSLIFSNIT